MIIETNITQYPNSDFLQFIRDHGDKRITQTSFNKYKEKSEDLLIIIVLKIKEQIIAVSSSVVKNQKAEFSITVTHREYRNKGYGSIVLSKKVKILKDFNFILNTIVAEDNEASLRICEKSNLIKTGSIIRSRSSGEYKAIIFEC